MSGTKGPSGTRSTDRTQSMKTPNGANGTQSVNTSKSPNGDVAVVGAGIVGLSTAFALKQRGINVKIFDPLPGSGQSTGQSRLFRHAHSDPRLIDFARRSRALWRQWEEEWGVELMSDGGAVAIGPGIEQKLEALQNFDNIPARTFSPKELRQVLPILADYQQPAMYDVDGGAIRTLSAIGALVDRLKNELVNDHVLSVRRTSSRTMEVRTGTGCGEFGHVVLCAGRGTAVLARGAGLSIPVEVTAHIRLTFPVREGAPSPNGSPTTDRFPTTSDHPELATLQDSSGAFGETGVYASPYAGNQFYSVGLGGALDVLDDGSIADPAELASQSDQTIAYVERALPGLNPRPVEYVHCWVTTLPWGEDGVAVWSADGLSAVAGHNLFKHAPALGESLAATAVGEPVPEQLRPEAHLGRE